MSQVITPVEKTGTFSAMVIDSVPSGLFDRAKISTPTLLLSREAIAKNYNDIKAALPGVEIHYAVKSNNHPVILRDIHKLGGKFDICSALEIKDVIRAGADPTLLIHSHPVKSEREFDSAIETGVRTFVVDNPSEIDKLRKYSELNLKILIRFRIAVANKAVVNLQYKFGCTTDEVLPLARRIRETGQEFHGLCFHIGSQCVHSENYVNAIEVAGELIKELRSERFETSMLDIGGGFPVQYCEPVPSLNQLCGPIRDSLASSIDPKVRIICEPGRAISASPVTLICSVIGKSIRDSRPWYYLDDGLYSTFSGIVFDQCRYPVVTTRKGKQTSSVLAGPTCDSFDIIYDGIDLPNLEIGDRLAFPMTGAYCAVSGSDFNSLERPDYTVMG